MTPDHYATLGIAPSSGEAAVRSAYLELMRRYHPDRNASAEAAARARAITAAYAVLSDWERRAEYDLKRARMRALEAGERPPRPPPSSTAWFALASVALLVLVAIRPPMFVTERADRLASAPVQRVAAPKTDPVTHCRSAAAREAIKRELFRRAAQLRGSDQAAFDRLARHSLVRIESPELVDENRTLATVDCAASVALDLPPGVAVLGGRRTLSAEVDYSVGTAALGGGPIRLFNEGLIVAPLATLVQVRAPAADPQPPPGISERALEALPRLHRPPMPPPLSRLSSASAPTRRAPAPSRVQAASKGTTSPAAQAQPTPSFSCRIARGRGETAVCKNTDLAKLDRHMGMLYGQSWGQADSAKRAKLLGTRDKFIARRDSCRSDTCISAAYIGRMREISDIMAAK